MCYHLITRGNNRSTVFRSASDYRQFIRVLGEAHERVPLDVFAMCLMPNHFHVVARPAEGKDLGRWMHWVLTTYVRRRRHAGKESGHLWQGRYKAFPVEQDGHLLTVLRYVERNALRADLVARAQDWPWGSLRWRKVADHPVHLAQPPVPLPGNWSKYVNSPQTPVEIEALRKCVHMQRPYGSPDWIERFFPDR